MIVIENNNDIILMDNDKDRFKNANDADDVFDDDEKNKDNIGCLHWNSLSILVINGNVWYIDGKHLSIKSILTIVLLSFFVLFKIPIFFDGLLILIILNINIKIINNNKLDVKNNPVL